MVFADNNLGATIDLTAINESDLVKALFFENPGLVIQVADADDVIAKLSNAGVTAVKIGQLSEAGKMKIKNCCAEMVVITSYSIHYTKLYESISGSSGPLGF